MFQSTARRAARGALLSLQSSTFSQPSFVLSATDGLCSGVRDAVRSCAMASAHSTSSRQRGYGFTSFAASRQAETAQEQHAEELTTQNASDEAAPREIVSNYRSKMDALQKRRKRVPLSGGESYEAWLEKNDRVLEPLREFFVLHEMDSAWAIAELYKNGYWGKKLMVGWAQGKVREESEEGAGKAEGDTTFPWEKALDVWSKAFEDENLPHSPIDIMRRWPSLVCKTPDCLPGTVAVLRAAIPDEDALNETIAMFPRVLVQSPVKLQHRVLALQMACGMDLSRILPKNPQLFYRNLDAIMTNVRYLRDHSWTLEHFANLIEYRPNVLTMHPDVLKRNTESSLEALSMILPAGADPKLVMRAKPQLILVSAANIDERWNLVKSMADQVPEWAAELDDAMQDIMDAAKTVAVPKDGDEDDWEQGEWGSSVIGSALWSQPQRHQRLRFLIESGFGDEGDAVPSLVDVLTVHYHRFSHRYRGFGEWVDEVRESDARV